MGTQFHGKTLVADPKKTFFRISALTLTVLLILTASAGWFMDSSQKVTETSVHNVSEFYLQELSTQTGDHLQSNLDYLAKNLQNAIQTIRPQDLADDSSLQDCLQDAADIFGFDFYALFDKEGTVYAADGTFSEASSLDFFSGINFCQPVNSISQTRSPQSMVTITTPVQGLTFKGKPLSGGMIGINANAVLAKLSLKNDANQIFSNIILRDGSYVVSTDHSHLKNNANVFSALKTQAVFQEGCSPEQMQENIQAGKSGITAYYLQNLLHYTYYAPVEGTDWYLTTTIHYDTVSTNIETVHAAITRNSLIQLFLVLSVILAVLITYFRQRLKTETLRIEKIQAEESSKAKSLFLSNMSHDIRTPMNAIVGFTNLAIQHEGDANPKRIHDYLIKIRTASIHLLNLINDVLDMSRIESGKMHLHIAPCRLSEILSNMETIAHGQVLENKQTLEIKTVNLNQEYILCDKLRLNQVLLNLLGNAIKFTPQGGHIFVTLSQISPAREGCGFYEFRVKDNGIGMTPEFAKRVFEPFERERSSTVSGIQGTGLGMAITKNIIDLMGGSIRVETALNQGSEFIIQLEFKLQSGSSSAAERPLKQPPTEQILEGGTKDTAAAKAKDTAAAETENMEATKAEDFEAAAANFQGKKILLVEDNALNREIASEILLQYGFEIDEAEDGSVAVRLLQNAPPGRYDAVLMDIQMPIMDGYTATRSIRALKGSPYAHIPIIAMTANAFEEDRKLAFESGMDGHIAKPVDVELLIQILAELLGNR